MSNLNLLGYNKHLEDKTDKSKISQFTLARVTSVNKNSYTISIGEGDIYAELTGRFLYNTDSPADLPTTGDWVYTQLFDDNTFSVIHEVVERQTVLSRKAAGKRGEEQLIAANIDYAIIIQALDNNFNLRRLERYLVMINESKISPLVFLSKNDLADSETIEKCKSDILLLFPDIEVKTFSNNKKEDTDEILTSMIKGKTYCLIGSSGVGKTTLLNNLLKSEVFKTGEVREQDGKGKHTTTRRELTILETGAIIIDTPGMREFGITSAESGLDSTFMEITELADNCKFTDCTHTVEKGCAIIEALNDGRISNERYNNYIRMEKESAFYKLSNLERRQKEKEFGKFIHSAKKTMRKKR